MRLVDADELQKRICDAKCGCEYEKCPNEGDCIFGYFILHAPTIDAEPVRHGKWEGLRCSECGRVSWSNTNYCQHCGAKMDGE